MHANLRAVGLSQLAVGCEDALFDQPCAGCLGSGYLLSAQTFNVRDEFLKILIAHWMLSSAGRSTGAANFYDSKRRYL